MTTPLLSHGDVIRLTNDYIGVQGGYLGDFSYRTHEEFYPLHCELDINPAAYEGTTRQRFVSILQQAEPRVQARIIRGVLLKYPAGSDERRTEERFAYFERLADRLDGAAAVAPAVPARSTDTIARALADADVLLREQGPTSAVDRVHTAIHGYLLAVCDEAGLAYPNDASLTQLFKVLRENHPSLATAGPRDQDIQTVVRACGAILDAFNPVRNKASVAHPNKELLGDPEAMLVINVGRTLLHYLDARIG